jgi:hypothetical protein
MHVGTVDGLFAAGYQQLAGRVFANLIELIVKSGFAEYYNAVHATTCGDRSFAWTTAMVLEFLHSEQPADKGKANECFDHVSTQSWQKPMA